MIVDRSNNTMPPKQMKEWSENNGEEKPTSSTVKELERASLLEGLKGVVEKSTSK